MQPTAVPHIEVAVDRTRHPRSVCLPVPVPVHMCLFLLTETPTLNFLEISNQPNERKCHRFLRKLNFNPQYSAAGTKFFLRVCQEVNCIYCQWRAVTVLLEVGLSLSLSPSLPRTHILPSSLLPFLPSSLPPFLPLPESGKMERGEERMREVKMRRRKRAGERTKPHCQCDSAAPQSAHSFRTSLNFLEIGGAIRVAVVIAGNLSRRWPWRRLGSTGRLVIVVAVT